MSASKKKKFTIFIVASFIVVIVAIGVLLFISFTYKNSGLKMSGTYFDNMVDFKVDLNQEELDDVQKAYFKSITYEIVDINDTDSKATIIVSVPDLKNVLPEIVGQILSEHNEDYEKLLDITKIRMIEVFDSKLFDINEKTVVLEIGEVNGLQKLVPNEDWDSAIMGELENMYTDYYKILIGEMTDEIPK